MNKRITLKDLYLNYDYKWYDVNSTTIPVPYFNKKEIVEHDYTLSYKEWKNVIMVYFKYVMLYLISGKCFVIPNFLGDLCLKKWKPKGRRINLYATEQKYGEYNKTVEKEDRKYIYHNNYHTGGYCPLLKWVRDRKQFAYKWHWRFDLTPHNWKFISKNLMKDASMINRLIEY